MLEEYQLFVDVFLHLPTNPLLADLGPNSAIQLQADRVELYLRPPVLCCWLLQRRSGCLARLQQHIPFQKCACDFFFRYFIVFLVTNSCSTTNFTCFKGEENMLTSPKAKFPSYGQTAATLFTDYNIKRRLPSQTDLLVWTFSWVGNNAIEGRFGNNGIYHIRLLFFFYYCCLLCT